MVAGSHPSCPASLKFLHCFAGAFLLKESWCKTTLLMLCRVSVLPVPWFSQLKLRGSFAALLPSQGRKGGDALILVPPHTKPTKVRSGPGVGKGSRSPSLLWCRFCFLFFSFFFLFICFPEIAAVAGILRARSQKAEKNRSTNHIQTEHHCLLSVFLFFCFFLFCLMEGFDTVVFCSVRQKENKP